MTKELFNPVNLGTIDDATLEPEMQSYAFEADTNEQYIHMGQEVTIKDKVTITQALEKGKSYILKTAIVDKKTGNFIKDINGLHIFNINKRTITFQDILYHINLKNKR